MSLTPELTFLIALLVFWTALYALSRVFHLEKHGLDVKPAYFMYKSKRLNSFLDWLANRRRFVWLTFSNIGVAFGVGLMIFSIYFFASNLARFLGPAVEAVPVFPVLPGLTIRLYWLPYFFVGAAVVILSHESAHGVIARLENIPVLSTGVAMMLVFFGAFVEPDEKEFEKAPLLARLRMLGAGSATNLVTALLFFLLIEGLFAAPAGVMIQETLPNGPVEKVGLRQWDMIDKINDTRIAVPDDYYTFMEKQKPGAVLVLHTNKGTFSVTTEEGSEGQAILGLWPVAYRPSRLGLEHYTGVNLYLTLFWIHVIALSVAIFNMLPLFPFDGERFLYYPLERLMTKHKREVRGAINALSLGLIALNMFLSLWKYGLSPI